MIKIILSNLLIILTVTLLGCGQTGPAALRAGRGSYNVAIQRTNSEQLLLNLVRLRYRDTPYFLEVASVSTSFDLTKSASAGASVPESGDAAYDLGAGFSLSEQPTVTYTPLQGDEFVAQLMSPVDLNTLLLLYHSGWSVERIFRVCVQNINGVRNAPSASGPTPTLAPVYAEFLEVARILRELQIKNALNMGHTVTDPNDTVVQLRIAPEFTDSSQVVRLCDLLGLEKGHRTLTLTTEVGTGGKDRIAVVTRSLMAALFYVSQSVEPPLRDRHAGRVTITRDPNGAEFDWTLLTAGLMHIHSADRKPQNAYTAIHYRGAWFYIDDSDLTSKSTFSLLTQLFALQAGEIKSTGPILTLPVTH